MLNLHRLNLLREVHLQGSIVGAAKSFSRSPSVISQQLSMLERETGVELLTVKDRRATLTDEGTLLLRYVERAVTALEEAEAELERTQEEPYGAVRLATLSSIASFRLPELFKEVAQRHPQVVVHYRQADAKAAVELLSAGAIDVAIVEEVKFTPIRADAGIGILPLGREHIPAFWPAGKEASEPPTLQELASVPWVFEPEGTIAHHWARSCCIERGFEPRVLYTSPDYYTHMRFIEDGIAAGFLPGGFDRALCNPQKEIEFGDVDTSRKLYCRYRKSTRLRPATDCVITEIRALFTPDQSEGS